MAKELTLTRTFDAPRELVFKAWTDPALMAKWWGPHEFTTPVCKLDVRPSGKILVVMHGPKDTEFDIDLPMTGVFQEVDMPRRLVFTAEGIQDEKGVPQAEMIDTVTFEEVGGKTVVTLHVVVTKSTPAAAAALAGMEAGWSQSLDKLSVMLVKV